MAAHGWGGSGKKSSLQPLPKMKGLKGVAIPHQREGSHGRAPQRIKGEALPNPAAFGLGSSEELRVYLWLKQHKVPFQTQVNFDGGDTALGGQRADFVLRDYRKIIEVLGPMHDTPGQTMRDERKWANRRHEGWEVIQMPWDTPDYDAFLSEHVGRLVA